MKYASIKLSLRNGLNISLSSICKMSSVLGTYANRLEEVIFKRSKQIVLS